MDPRTSPSESKSAARETSESPATASSTAAEAEDQARLPNPIVVIYGFLQPYIDLRPHNQSKWFFQKLVDKSPLKKSIVQTLIESVKHAKTLKDWQSILDKLDTNIEEERNVDWATRAGRSFGKALSIIDDARILLILLLGARTYICHELREKNSIWQSKLQRDFEETMVLEKKIDDATAKPTLYSHTDIPEWKKRRVNLLRELSKQYHVDAIVAAMKINLFANEPVLLDDIHKAHPFIPEHLQPNFYQNSFAIVRSVYASKRHCENFDELVGYLLETYKPPSSPRFAAPAPEAAETPKPSLALGTFSQTPSSRGAAACGTLSVSPASDQTGNLDFTTSPRTR